MREYSFRHWAGLFSDYYYPRWKMYLDELIKTAKLKKHIDAFSIEKKMLEEVEKPFTRSTNYFTTEPIGNSNFNFFTNYFLKNNLIFRRHGGSCKRNLQRMEK